MRLFLVRPITFANLKDGVGLNQLLQNYWMVIHPPVLFLGFASTIVPFAFAIAGLWKKEYGGWTKQALALVIVLRRRILGLGIMMGAYWAYESLSFGGYWAWDPVENASLVPWLILVAGIHTQIVYQFYRALFRCHLFLLYSQLFAGFVFYLPHPQRRSAGYFGTRIYRQRYELAAAGTGVCFPGAFACGCSLRRYKKIPHIAKEENSYSREFWMFIGALVLFLSSVFIMVATSLPVINKIFGYSFHHRRRPRVPYNRIQVFVAVVLGVLTAVTQYLKYKNTAKAAFFKKIA